MPGLDSLARRRRPSDTPSLGMDLPSLTRSITDTPLHHMGGRLKSCKEVLTSTLQAAVGDQVAILARKGPVMAEVIAFEDSVSLLVPYDPPGDLQPGLTVLRRGGSLEVPTGAPLLGRVLDGLGRPLDNGGPLVGCGRTSVNRPAPAALGRARIRTPFVTGIRAIDGMLTCGRGQRVGIFAGSGVGKSTLLGEIARGSESDVNVIALIGERGREVGPFLEDCLGEEGMRRSVVIVATCEQTPLMRVRATQAATAIADQFRADGANVLLMIDSLTRLAMAQRELGLMKGEPPSSRGYTPSVFQELANTIERLGNASVGGITALLTVLVDGGDMDEPISDAVRSFVDGHIVLDRKIAERGFYPAIDVSRSISRVATEVIDAEHKIAARKFRDLLATYDEAKNLIHVGMYQKGMNPKTDLAVELMGEVERFLKQDVGEYSSYEVTRSRLLQLTTKWTY
jgi:flagellum-specific ATP synthase